MALFDCPNHKDKIKWHTPPATSCHMLQNWFCNKASSDVAVSLAKDVSTSSANATSISSLTDPTNALETSPASPLLAASPVAFL